MKDYYQILGIPDGCNDKEIKRAFRKLAFRYHPDTNPGKEGEVEEKFKEINEAYGVLGDKEKRQQYDFARKGMFTGAGYGGSQGFSYSQQDIFRDIFANPGMFAEMNRMFSQDGLRFDQDFLNRVFFTGNGMMFQVFTAPGGADSRAYTDQAFSQRQTVSTHRPGLMERFLSKIIVKLTRFVFGKLLGTRFASLYGQNLDHHVDFEVSPAEAASGGEKQVIYSRNNQLKKLMVKLPAGVKPGTRIRLRGMGRVSGSGSGDLYLRVKIKD